MNRNLVKPNKKNISGLKKQVAKYDSLQNGTSFLGFSKKKRKFVIKKWRKK
jgi:hypothetical protein